MKKLLYTLLAVSIIFSACKKEKENSSNTNITISVSNMVGVWNATSFILDGIDYTTIAGIQSLDVIIYSDMTFEERRLVANEPPFVFPGNWELSGSVLIFTYDTGEYVRYNINSLTNNTASLTLLEYLNNGCSEYSTGSCNLVKQ